MKTQNVFAIVSLMIFCFVLGWYGGVHHVLMEREETRRQVQANLETIQRMQGSFGLPGPGSDRQYLPSSAVSNP